MPIAKLKASNTLDAMKSEEGNDSLDTIIRQVAKEPSISFSRAGDSPVPWIQLLHALDQQELPGWPLHSPIKVQLQKCDKCPREFCSSINYRRHIRVHHRLKKLDKDSSKNRELLGAFWDKLSPEEAKEATSFKNVTLEEVPGSSIIKALTTHIRKPGFSSMPHIYLKAGSALLDIVQARPSRFPISSQELFSILDDASEKTFLSGTAISMQRYIFDGEAGKVGLESKNLVACTSFLVEQKLVKAWHADKDAEALRLQKLLVEEEEAAQRRQAELMERKRQKKLRQKEQKAKDQRHGVQVDVKENIDETLEAEPLVETSSPSATFDSDTTSSDVQAHDSLSLEAFQLSTADENVDPESQTEFIHGHTDSVSGPNVERRMVQGSGCRRAVVARWQVLSKSQRGVPNGFHGGQSSQTSKLSSVQNHGNHRDSRTASSGNKVWSRKPKPEYNGGSLKAGVQKEATEPDQIKNQEVLIGSISVNLGNCSQESDNLAGVDDDCLLEHQIPKNNAHDKTNKPDLVHSGTNRSTVKLWRPVSRHGTKGPMAIQNGNRASEIDVVAEKGNSQNPSSENCPRSGVMDGGKDGNGNGSTHLDETGSLRFSCRAAKDFLAQRWKEAIAADHVELVLLQDSEPPRCPDNQNDGEVESSHSLKFKRSILGNAENRLVNVEGLEVPTAGAAKVKYRTKPEKGLKIKYIPKQSTVT
ncbi:PREDICTED: C2H2 zinc finger [Prunus dulcis]|uniref:PREDICTED: C2H2 zinc finger n=1 Tax=Prunus dulcis TaxID=3755 RepID=A0A5E4E5M4_PRUDU|nr:uncharacterized protein LOC117619690 [Prunus dulcis]VVA11137.1 PREDICTED: C2H2 zinc finger [Prunus dulcis]